MWELREEDWLSGDSINPLLLQVLSQQQQLMTELVRQMAATQLAVQELVTDRAFTEDAPRFSDLRGEDAAKSDQAAEFRQPQNQAAVHSVGPERKHSHRSSGQTFTTNLQYSLHPQHINKMADSKHANLPVVDPLQPSSTSITCTPGITSAPASPQLLNNNIGTFCGTRQVDDTLVGGHAQVQHGSYPQQALHRPGEYVTTEIIPFRYVSVAKREAPPGQVLPFNQDMQPGRPTRWSGHRNPQSNGSAECPSITYSSSSSTGGEALRQTINAFLLTNHITSGRHAMLTKTTAELQQIGRTSFDGGTHLTVYRCTVWPWDHDQPQVWSGQLVCISRLRFTSPGFTAIDDPVQQQRQPANSTRRSCVTCV